MGDVNFQDAVGLERPVLITLNRKSVEQSGLLVVVVLRDALILGWRFGPRLSRCGIDLRQTCFRRRLGLSSKYSLRCHVERGCWRICESSCRMVMLGSSRPERWLVTITEETGSSVASATNSNATSTKPTAARKARAGIAGFDRTRPSTL